MFCRTFILCWLNCFAEAICVTKCRVLVRPALINKRNYEAGRPQNEIPYSKSAWIHKFTSFFALSACMTGAKRQASWPLSKPIINCDTKRT